MNTSKAFITMLTTLFSILFRGIRKFFMQFKRHLLRQWVLAGVLCACLLAVSMPFPVLAAENSEDVQENAQEEIQENKYDEIQEIVSFTELSDEINEQTDEGDAENSDGASTLAEDGELPEASVTVTEIMLEEETEMLADVSESATSESIVISNDTT